MASGRVVVVVSEADLQEIVGMAIGEAGGMAGLSGIIISPFCVVEGVGLDGCSQPPPAQEFGVVGGNGWLGTGVHPGV